MLLIIKNIKNTKIHSVINHGIIAREAAYGNNLELQQKSQNRVVQIVNKNQFVKDNPLKLRQLFAFECTNYHCGLLKQLYINSTSITRKTSRALPPVQKTVGDKRNYYKAIKVLNDLDDDLKSQVNYTRNQNKKLAVIQYLLGIGNVNIIYIFLCMKEQYNTRIM